MSKKRDAVKMKYGGKCAYSGQPLDEKWQVDHVTPKSHWVWQHPDTTQKPDDEANLIPCLRIINHYKRCKDLEQWREYLKTLHLRLKKLPKKTMVAKSKRHKEYLLEVAASFGITPDTPFSGIFYFETFSQHT